MNLTSNISWTVVLKILGAGAPLLIVTLVLSKLSVNDAAQFLLFVTGIKYVQIFDLSISASLNRSLAHATGKKGLNTYNDSKFIARFFAFFTILGTAAAAVGILYVMNGLGINLTTTNFLLMIAYIVIEFSSKLSKIHWAIILKPYLMNVPGILANLMIIVALFFDLAIDLSSTLNTFLISNIVCQCLMIYVVQRQWRKAPKRIHQLKNLTFFTILSEASVTSLISIGNIIFRATVLVCIAKIDESASTLIYTIVFQIVSYVVSAVNFAAPLSTTIFAKGYRTKITKNGEKALAHLTLTSMGIANLAIACIQLIIFLSSIFIQQTIIMNIDVLHLSLTLSSALPIIFVLPAVNLLRNVLLAHKHIVATSLGELTILTIFSAALYMHRTNYGDLFFFITTAYLLRHILLSIILISNAVTLDKHILLYISLSYFYASAILHTIHSNHNIFAVLCIIYIISIIYAMKTKFSIDISE